MERYLLEAEVERWMFVVFVLLHSSYANTPKNGGGLLGGLDQINLIRLGGICFLVPSKITSFLRSRERKATKV